MSLCSLDVWPCMRALVMASYGRVRLLTRGYLVLASALILTACGLSYGQTAQAMGPLYPHRLCGPGRLVHPRSRRSGSCDRQLPRRAVTRV